MNQKLLLLQEAKIESSPPAVVHGKPVTELPRDLYIPPHALRIFFEIFEGPFDLLLYLIKKQNLDILDIPVATITCQYIEYIELMSEMQFELAAEYLLMAAMLTEIKSRMLLPRPIEEEDEDDPRAELVRRLQEYERFKQAAEDIDQLPRRGRDTFVAFAATDNLNIEKLSPKTKIELQDLFSAFKDVLQRVALKKSHHLQREPLSVRDRMTQIIATLKDNNFLPFNSFFELQEGRMGVVVSFIAILELFRNAMIEVVQTEPFAPIHIKKIA